MKNNIWIEMSRFIPDMSQSQYNVFAIWIFYRITPGSMIILTYIQRNLRLQTLPMIHNYLNLRLEFDENYTLYTQLYDKRDDF